MKAVPENMPNGVCFNDESMKHVHKVWTRLCLSPLCWKKKWEISDKAYMEQPDIFDQLFLQQMEFPLSNLCSATAFAYAGRSLILAKILYYTM